MIIANAFSIEIAAKAQDDYAAREGGIISELIWRQKNLMTSY